MLEIENQNIPEPAPPHSSITAHPFLSALAGAGALFVIGVFIVIQHSVPTTSAPKTTAWGGDIGTLTDRVVYTPNANNTGNDILHQVQENPPYSYTIPTLDAAQGQQPAPTQNNSFNYKNFLTNGGQPTGHMGVPAPTGTTDITYAFPPAALFSTSPSAVARTNTEQSLYNYGNEVGSYIQTYEQAYPDQTTVLKNQIEDPRNPDKAQAVIRMAHDLGVIGSSMSAMENVPPQVATASAAVAASYQLMGQSLALVPRAQGTDAVLQAIKIYNASAEKFAKNFVSLATTFSTYGVTFSTDEAGSSFTFTYSN